MDDSYDLVLYLDADILIMGKAQMGLDLYAPNGDAQHPLAAVRDVLFEGRTFNAGVMAIRTSHDIFAEMLEAGKTLDFNPDFAEQAFLNEYLQRGQGWAVLPAICNLLTLRANEPTFQRVLESALILHFSGDVKVR
jgi:lipopolysaccharide biosynthesis glycosyltransferase